MREIKSKKLEELVAFPCDFSVKVIGFKSDQLRAAILSHFQATETDVNLQDITETSSKGDKYLSVTVPFKAKSADHVKGLFKRLSEDPNVVMCL